MTIDLISDMITRLRNAAIINKKLISLPFNKNNYIIIKILEREGYIFCSTFINNRDKLFLKLLELIFIKKNLSYNDTRVKNLLFFIRNFVKIHQNPENIKKYSKSEKKALSFLNTIDNNLIKEENFSDLKDLGDPMSSLISKFKDSYIDHKKVKSNSSSRRQSLFTTPFVKKSSASRTENSTKNQILKERGIKKPTFSNQELQAKNSKIDNFSFLDSMDANFSINNLSASILELKKNFDEISSNLNITKVFPRSAFPTERIQGDTVNNNSNEANSNLARFSAATGEIKKTLDDMHSNLMKLNKSCSNLFENDKNKAENIISTLTHFQNSLDETHSLIPMPISMRKISKNLNISDLEISLTKLTKHKDDIQSHLFKLSKNTDDLQFNIKRSCQQVAKLNINLRNNKYPNYHVDKKANQRSNSLENEFIIIASKQQKNLEDLKSNFRYELNKNIDDIILYFSRLTKRLDAIASSFNITELKKYFDIKSMQTPTELKKLKNPFTQYQTSNNIDLKSYITYLPFIKLELKKNLEFVTSKFNDFSSVETISQISSNSLQKNEKQIDIKLKDLFNDIDSILSHLPSDPFEFSNNFQANDASVIDEINSYISRLSAVIFELKKNSLAFPRSAFHTERIKDGTVNENSQENNLTFSNSTDKPLKNKQKLGNLRKRSKPEEHITRPEKQSSLSVVSNSPYASNSSLQKEEWNINRNLEKGDSINNPISTLEKKEHIKPLNLQKYLRKKNNKTFQTLFNPNFSKIILLALNLNSKEKSSIHGIRRISKPSLRCYSSNPIPRSFGGLGIFIVSTNCGIMTDNEAREKKLGGEIMLEIW